MVERLTITAMGKHRLRNILEDRILTALKNMATASSDEERAIRAADAVIAQGEYSEFPDHGLWHDRTAHQ